MTRACVPSACRLLFMLHSRDFKHRQAVLAHGARVAVAMLYRGVKVGSSTAGTAVLHKV